MNERTDPAPIKSMEMFAIDNQHAWGKDAKLVGDLVTWPDRGMYPGYVPVGLLTHPAFDGTIVVQAGNLGVLVTFLPGIPSKNKRGIMDAMSDKVRRPEQYRISVDALVHRLLLAGGGTGDGLSIEPAPSQGKGVEPLALIAWLARTAPAEAAVMQAALKEFSKNPQSLAFGTRKDPRALMPDDAFNIADGILATLDAVQRES